MLNPLLSVKDLSVRRGDVKILHGINWEMQPGENWVILGANGSGKTSLLAALTGYLTFSSGRVTVLGETFGECEWRELRKRIGMVSSTVRQQIPEGEEAEITVMTGREAVIGHWGQVRRADRAEAGRMLEQLVQGAGASSMAGAVAGRTAEDFDRARANGEYGVANSR